MLLCLSLSQLLISALGGSAFIIPIWKQKNKWEFGKVKQLAQGQMQLMVHGATTGTQPLLRPVRRLGSCPGVHWGAGESRSVTSWARTASWGHREDQAEVNTGIKGDEAWRDCTRDRTGPSMSSGSWGHRLLQGHGFCLCWELLPVTLSLSLTDRDTDGERKRK